MKWISVKERLPEKYQNVLFYGTGFDPIIGKHRGNICVGYYRDGFRFDGSDSTVINVTYWMPLPDPPEGSTT